MDRKMHLILASKSPRRREILENLGITFTVQTQETDESCSVTDPAAFVEELARRKGSAVTCAPDSIVLSADTVVVADGKILGKPHCENECLAMMRTLSGHRHTVVTGFSLSGYIDGKPVCVSSHTETIVDFDVIDEADALAYACTKEPYDKAGGYAIQGHAALWIRGIFGCYYNVVGLPVHDVQVLLRDTFGLTLKDFS